MKSQNPIYEIHQEVDQKSSLRIWEVYTKCGTENFCPLPPSKEGEFLRKMEKLALKTFIWHKSYHTGGRKNRLLGNTAIKLISKFHERH